MPQISVIVPVYNVEAYLHQCIDSILAQTFTDFELILVDDGSPDKCGIICDEYAAKDSRIRVIHKENGGVSAARNSGLDVARGEYITFCDSDDYWGPSRLEDLINVAFAENADVVISNFTVMDESQQICTRTKHSVGTGYTVSEEEKFEYITNNILNGKHGWEIWSRIFKAEIIHKNKIRFCLACKNYAEDLAFTLEYALFTRKWCSVVSADYFYVTHCGSMMSQSQDVVKLDQLNEVSAHFGERFFGQMKSKVFHRLFPVLHFQMLHTEYRKVIGTEYYSNLSSDIAHIKNKRWFQKQTRGLFQCHRYLNTIYGRRVSQQILLFTVYCLHRNWRRYSYESAIAYRWFIKEV